MIKRKLKVAVISDIHLGTFGSRAEEVLLYLKSIEPEYLILNGDIIDGWQFKKKYWPVTHTKVIKEILNHASKGVKVFYLPGNHDECFRRFVDYEMGNLKIDNKLVLNLDGKLAWFFHGDVFDVTMQHSKWLTRLGSESYDFLIWLNYQVNKVLSVLGKEKRSFSKQIKNGVKSAVKYINSFEDTCAQIAIEKGYDYVLCGHIHQPEIRSIQNEEGGVVYLNSGDWVENLTALEYQDQRWSIYTYDPSHYADFPKEVTKPQKEIYNEMLLDFDLEAILK